MYSSIPRVPQAAYRSICSQLHLGWAKSNSISKPFTSFTRAYSFRTSQITTQYTTQRMYFESPLALSHRTLSTSRPPSPTLQKPEEKKKRPKLGDLFNQYGPVFAVYYASLWSSSGLILYGLVSSGIVGPSAGLDVIRFLHLDSVINVQNINPDLGNMGLAVLLNEMLEPARLALAVFTTPMVARKWNAFRGHDATNSSTEPVKKSKARKMAEKYGFFFTMYWGSMYGLMYAGTFASLHFGMVDVDLVVDFLKKYTEDYVNLDAVNSPVGHAALALGINELLEVVRLPFVLGTTPLLHRLLVSPVPEEDSKTVATSTKEQQTEENNNNKA